jgi:hypothetical protein
MGTKIPRIMGYSFVFIPLIILMMLSAPATQLAYAGGKSPYESGYDHGCDDADISDPDDRYINQPERGP